MLINKANFYNKAKHHIDRHGWAEHKPSPIDDTGEHNYDGFVVTHFSVLRKGMSITVQFYHEKDPENKLGDIIYNVKDFIN